MQRTESDLIVMQARSNMRTNKESTDMGPTIYFDGSCPLCTAETGYYASREGGDRLGFVDVSADGAQLGADLPSSEAMCRFHVRLTDGTLVSGARAFVEVWDSLPSWQWAARLAKLPGLVLALEGTYRVFLTIRPAVAKLARRFGAQMANPGSSLK
jgi:predicted DCC family thiol-disulfide oxidoreductase YuxK